MNSLARKFFQTESNFVEAKILSEQPMTWEELTQKPTDLPRGWFELARISARDRIDFISDFWLNSFPFRPAAHPLLTDFFSRLDDIAVVLRKEKDDDLLSAELVYSLADNSCFFRGLPSATDADIAELKLEMGALLPRDYIAFLHIHNGFGKLSDLGVLKIEDVPEARRRVMELILEAEAPVKSGDVTVDAGALIPFFEVYGLSSFQCFYTDWYPGSEMGNVYLSGVDYTISDTNDWRSGHDTLSFPTFLNWLAQYLQGMNVSA